MTATEKRCWALVRKWRKEIGYAIPASRAAFELEAALKPRNDDVESLAKEFREASKRARLPSESRLLTWCANMLEQPRKPAKKKGVKR